MNYNTLGLKLSSCLHGSTLTSLSLSLSLPSCLPLFFMPPCRPVSPPPPPLLFAFCCCCWCRPFSTPAARSSFTSLHRPFYSDSHLFRYISHFIPFLPPWPPLLLFTPCVLASPPPPPPPPPPPLPSLHLISDTLTWLSPLLPQEAGEPLFPLIPANAICKHRRRLAIKAAAASKAGRGVNHSRRGRLNPRLI